MLESVAALTATGWDVTVVLPSDGPLVPLLKETGAQTLIMPIPVLRKSKMSVAGLISLAWETARSTPSILRLLRRYSPDVVYISTVTIPWVAVVAKLLGQPSICHVHEAEDTASRPIRIGLSAQLLLSRRVIANSNSCRDLILRDIPLLGHRTSVIYNGVNRSDYRTDTTQTDADRADPPRVGRAHCPPQGHRRSGRSARDPRPRAGWM